MDFFLHLLPPVRRRAHDADIPLRVVMIFSYCSQGGFIGEPPIILLYPFNLEMLSLEVCYSFFKASLFPKEVGGLFCEVCCLVDFLFVTLPLVLSCLIEEVISGASL